VLGWNDRAAGGVSYAMRATADRIRGERTNRRQPEKLFLVIALVGAVLVGLLPTGTALADPPLKTRAIGVVSVSYGEFMTIKRSPARDKVFDWSTDGCSWTPPPWNWEHRAACEQHDFGYRNFGNGLRLERTESRRAWIDQRFLTEMLRNCRQHWWYPNCVDGAYTMYAVVRNFNNWRD
jgi:Prokaryotic phospholipase A2